MKYAIFNEQFVVTCDEDGKIPLNTTIVYHKYVMPNPNPEKFVVVKRVFIGNRSYHLPRVAIYFRKKFNDSMVD